MLVRLTSLSMALVLLAACGDDHHPQPAQSLPALHATRGEQPGIFDALGRQVLLRGMNLNSLGDYYRASPELPEVYPFEESFMAEMAADGFNVVRLIVSWSALEPERGHFDGGYLDRIRAAVRAAGEHGIYVVLDMHQDAWGKFIATPPDVSCTVGTEPAIGWDGAPAWATLTDGGSTCRSPGFRESAPAVVNAFANFYDDRDDIQSHFVVTWALLAKAFADDPTIAGYDLINEPHYVQIGRKETAVQLGQLYRRTIDAIRAAEDDVVSGFHHIVFFEPLINFPLTDSTPPLDFTDDENIVFAPHNYAESINSFFSIEQQFQNIQRWAARFQTTFWIGEYGWFGDPANNRARVQRYGVQEDQYLVGGTWWQWLQACGDPHVLSGAVAAGNPMPGVDAAPAEQTLYHLIECPSAQYRVIPEWQQVLARARPLAAPGRILSLTSDSTAGTLELSGDSSGAAADARLELWVPERGLGTPELTGPGLGEVEIRTQPGGYRLLAEVTGSYDVMLQY